VPVRHLVVIDPAGLHARPAARFVQVASRFACGVTIRAGGRDADAKSLIAVLGLTVRPASEIVLLTEGEDAEAALAALIDELRPYVAATADVDHLAPEALDAVPGGSTPDPAPAQS
jgi:phosphotransferase system HPr (HPr) family protein